MALASPLSKDDLMNNSLYLRRRSKIVVSPTQRQELLPLTYVAAVAKNLESLGYSFSQALIDELRLLTIDELTAVYEELVEAARRLRGVHKPFKPMYPNFPQQVMEMSKAELYINAILHYWTAGQYLPETEKKERLPLLDEVDLKMIDLGTESDFQSIFTRIAASNTSISVQDKEDLDWFVQYYRSEITRMLPQSIPQKENVAHVCGLLLKYVDDAVDTIGKLTKTATDVLRIAVAMSDGDVSLAEPVKFRVFSRRERRLLLSFIDRIREPVEDMLRWKERWKRLGERLHPGDFANTFPNAYRAFRVLRKDTPFTTFNGGIEAALVDGAVQAAVDKLVGRPGDFARRLDHLLRRDLSKDDAVITAFGKVVDTVSTPVLLQVMTHFHYRNVPANLRVFFPKGQVAKAQAIDYNLPSLPEDAAHRVFMTCRQALVRRFSALPSLGAVYVDPGLAKYLIPFSQRSASKALRTIVRGSRVGLPAADTLRFFIWWKDGKERTDLDLSAVMFDADFNHVDEIAYYNLTDMGGHHSGDIVSAPNGACEFIDVSIDKMIERGAAFVVMMVNSYTSQPYVDLPECFAGWMARQHANSGEIFDPKTVQDRFDLTANSQIALPIIFDLKNREAVWSDLSLKGNPRWVNNVAGNRKGITIGLRAMCELRKTTLYDLLTLHAEARGRLASMPEDADVVFSVDAGTPFELDTIASQFMT